MGWSNEWLIDDCVDTNYPFCGCRLCNFAVMCTSEIIPTSFSKSQHKYTRIDANSLFQNYLLTTLGSSHVSYHYILGVIPYDIYTFLHSTQNAEKKKKNHDLRMFIY